MADLGTHLVLGQWGTQHPDPYAHQDHILRDDVVVLREIIVLFLEGGRYSRETNTLFTKHHHLMNNSTHKTNATVESIGVLIPHKEKWRLRGEVIHSRSSGRGVEGSGSSLISTDSEVLISHLLAPFSLSRASLEQT